MKPQDVPRTFVKPMGVPRLAVEGLPPGAPAFEYPWPKSTNTPYILHVHGWNMERWEKDRFAETMYKRLYWEGYQGRFGSFRWPTFDRWPSHEKLNSFDMSEEQAWRSGAPLRYLLTCLNDEYGGQVRLTAHSMGNVVAGEALRTNTVLVSHYVAMQAAVPSRAYDQNAPYRAIPAYARNNTPELYHDYPGFNPPAPYFSQAAGAGVYVNFYNERDWALGMWLMDQDLKPAGSMGYYYRSDIGFYHQNLVGWPEPLAYDTNTFKLFAYCVEGQCKALGAQAGVKGAFNSDHEVNLNSKYAFGDAHKGHSAQFRSTLMQRWAFWSDLRDELEVANP